MKKVITIFMILVICLGMNLFSNQIYAVKVKPMEPKNGTTGGAVTNIVGDAGSAFTSPIDNPDYYQPGSQDSASGADKLKNMGNTIIGALQVIGTIISVVVLIVIGIKYMVGSAEERAEYKKSMTPYIIGAVMVFAITNLLAIVAEISKSLL